MKRNIYALIVGIDDYPSCPLNGCVADTQKVINYLKSDLVTRQYDVKYIVLNNSDAERLSIITAFQNHLTQAGENDIALFYFSGHGAEEIADKSIWHEDGNRKLQGLVCHDSLDTLLLLVDKELRVLINGVSKNNAHVLTIFDCCHSGGNTRGFVEGAETTKRQFAHQRMGQEFPQRKWKQFFFNKKIDLNTLKSEPLNEVIPQGNQVQLAACQSNQSAYETNIKDWGKGGIFTYTLLQILNRSKGMVTYYDLKSRILHFIKNQYNQTPTIYVKGDKRGEIYKNFLGGEQSSTPLYGNLVYNKIKQAWILDMGAIHGISKQAETVNVIVNEIPILAKIIKVNATDAVLELDDVTIFDVKEAYKAYVHPFKSAPIGVFINDSSIEQLAKNELVDLIEKNGSNINLTEQEYLADYAVYLEEKDYFITLPGDQFRPLVMPVDEDDTNAILKIFNQLYHISQWEFARQLHNSDTFSQINADVLQVDITKLEGGGGEVIIDNDQIDMRLSSVGEEGKISIRLTNTSNRKLYVAVLYLGINFEVFPDFLEAGVQLLEPKGFVDLKIEGDVEIPYYLDDCKRLFNWKKSKAYFKIIINTQNFDVNNLVLDALEDPVKLFEEIKRGQQKGIGRRQKSDANAERWTTRLLAFNVYNPNYNYIRIKALKRHLKTTAASFVAGLYLQQPENYSTNLVFKKEIKTL